MSSCHEGIECDNCEMKPIKGIRYKSKLLKDYNICENCYKKKDEMGLKDHPFEIINISKKKDSHPPKKDNKSIHKDVTCSYCKMGPIIGVRYYCTSKDDEYNLCCYCFEMRDEIGSFYEDYIMYEKEGDEGMIIPQPLKGDKREKHGNIQCNRCKIHPIIGKRYQCVNRFDYDLCEECYKIRGSFGMQYEGWYEYIKNGVVNRKISKPRRTDLPYPMPRIDPVLCPKGDRIGGGGGDRIVPMMMGDPKKPPPPA